LPSSASTFAAASSALVFSPRGLSFVGFALTGIRRSSASFAHRHCWLIVQRATATTLHEAPDRIARTVTHSWGIRSQLGFDFHLHGYSTFQIRQRSGPEVFADTMDYLRRCEDAIWFQDRAFRRTPPCLDVI